MNLLLKNATYINWKTLDFKQTDIFIEKGEGGKILFDNIDEKKVDEKIDCSGKLVTKSFAVGHHHTYSALARGMPPPMVLPENFLEILKYIWWTLDKCLDKEMVRASALVTAITCAKAGSTFIIDHHASPNFIEGSLNTIKEAFDEVGLSHLLCYEITDRDGTGKADKALSETEKYLRNNQALVGLHASFTLKRKTLQKAADLMEKYNTGVHIHVAEDIYDQKHCMKNYNQRVVERLNDFSLLDSSKTIFGHCIHLDRNEREMLRNSEVYIVQNMESNLQNKVGIFNSKGLGDNIMSGTDGMHGDMIRSAQAAYFASQNLDNLNYKSLYKRFRNVHNYIEKNKFTGDGENNLIVMDYPSPTPISKTNFMGHFVFGFNSSYIQHVISNGELIVKDRVIQKVKENEVMQYAREQAVRLWEAMKK